MKPLLGLLGVILAAMAGDLNDQVVSVALPDLRGSLGIGYDQGSWVENVYLSAQPLGMATSAWFIFTIGLRPWAIFGILFVAVSSLLVSFTSDPTAYLVFRGLQGLAGGVITPLIVDTALIILSPASRLYGLALYGMTATLVPPLTTSVNALWIDTYGLPQVYYQALPMCAIGLGLALYGLPEENADRGRFRIFNWRGALLIAVVGPASTIALYQGARLDWFNSPLICVLLLVSLVGTGLLLVNEWYHPLPFLNLRMMRRPNFTYGIICVPVFIVAATYSSSLPITYLETVNGLRPAQAQWLTFYAALSQLLLLPLVAWILDHERMDARVVAVIGATLMLAGCLIATNVNMRWNIEQFIWPEALGTIGEAMFIIPVLMIATNAVQKAEEAPFASAMTNFPRSIGEAVAPCLLGLVDRMRGQLHSQRLVDRLGQYRFDTWVPQRGCLPRDLSIVCQSHESMGVREVVRRQVEILAFADKFTVWAGLILFLIVMTLALPTRTPPPRILFGEENS